MTTTSPKSDERQSSWRTSAGQSCLVIVDVQEQLFVAVPSGPRVEANIALLLDVADALEIPVIVTEHMAEKIGRTITPLSSRFPKGAEIVAKSYFAATDEPTFSNAITAMAASGRTTFLVTGMEAHVCVQQTALGLTHLGHTVMIAADAVGSRDHEDKTIAIERLRDRGCEIVTAEAIAFEWLERGDTPAFRKLLRTIRDRRTIT